MLRESVAVFFTVALIGIAKFGYDIAKGLITNGVEAIVNGFLASIIGLVVAIVVVLASGYWLIRDDRRRRAEELCRHKEIIKAIESINNEQGKFTNKDNKS